MSDEERDAKSQQTRREFLATTAAAGLGVVVGCGGDDGATAPDAGAVADSGFTPDGGLDAALPDAGTDAGALPVVVPEDTPEGLNFPLGVASGDATTESVMLWARYDGLMGVRLAVWEMDGESYVRTVFDGEVVPDEAGYVHEDVAGLVPGARFRYAFFESEGETRVTRSRIGRFRAPPAPDARETLLVGAVSCVSNSRSHATLERAGERDDLDLFLFLGDSTYNDGARTLEEYRAKWVENMGTDGYRAVRAAQSALATWDDHEFDNDWNPETFDAAQLAAAKQTFFEHQPVRRDGASPDRVWKSMRWGATLEVFVLDCRSERMPSTRGSADSIYVSREQMDWLKGALAASDAVFKVIMNSVPIGDFPSVFDFPTARNDRWESYGSQREEILRHIDETPITGVLWLSGDFHMASMGRVSPSGPGSTQLEILAGPGAQTGNVGARILGAPQWDWASEANNYTVLELDPETRRLRAFFVDGSGSVLEVGEYVL